MEQYAIRKFAEAFEVFPKILAENTGLKANEVLANMYNAHQDKVSGMNAGINLEVIIVYHHLYPIVYSRHVTVHKCTSLLTLGPTIEFFLC